MDVMHRTALVTGATDGVGRLAARRLAAGGARVLVHGRSENKGRDTVEEIRRETGNADVEFFRADFASLDEVRQLARDVTRAPEPINLLINNAGIGFGIPGAGREVSRDGYELRFAVNYLATFLLTHLLLPVLQQNAPARIVNVASLGQAPLDFDDLMMTKRYDGTLAYRRSKLAMVMFTFDLAEELRGTNITVNALHPATFMNTKMVTEAGIAPHSSVDEGAEAILHVALAPELERTSGAFFDGQRESRAMPDAYQPAVRQLLRASAAKLTGLHARV